MSSKIRRPAAIVALPTAGFLSGLGLVILGLPTQMALVRGAQAEKKRSALAAPRTWNDAAMATLEVPLAHPIGSPKHVSADYYYRIPVRPIYKSYPVYAPGHEPAGYMDWLKQQEPVVVWDDKGNALPLETELGGVLLSLTLFAAMGPSSLLIPTPDPEKEAAFRWLDANADAMRRVSLNIWNTPELALQEYKSSRELTGYLKNNGFHIEEGAAGMPTAFMGTYGSGKPVIAIYGEYDALAGLSQKAEPSLSPVKEGAPGHGCGHNLIGASSAAATVAVSKLMETGKIKGTLRFYGTPAEESIGGKTYMLEAGLFNSVDVLIGWHPQDRTDAGFQYSKAVASVRFKFKGVSAHAASAPQVGRSALKGVELLDIGVNFMREHVKEDARIHSVITNGGGQPNVVPALAESWYNIRANKHEDVADMFEWVSEIARGAAMMTRTQVEITLDNDMYELLPNRPLAEVIDRNLRLVGPPKFTDPEKAAAKKMQEPLKKNIAVPLSETVEPLPETPAQGLFSTDASNVSWNVPTEIFEVATYPYRTPIHSWQVTACSGMSIGQKGMMVAAKTLAATAIDLFENPSLVEAAKKELEEHAKKRPFHLLTPPNRKPPIAPEPQ